MTLQRTAWGEIREFWREVRDDPVAWAGFRVVAGVLLAWVVLPAVVITAGVVAAVVVA